MLFEIGRNLPACRQLPDHSYLSRIGGLGVRVTTAMITVTTETGRGDEVYWLITTILDPACPPEEIVALYHQRWEIETVYFELKSTILGGRVLRARTPSGVEQEIYTLLVHLPGATDRDQRCRAHPTDVDPDRGSFGIALNAARDQLITAMGVLTDTAPNAVIDLVGELGRQVLDHLMPA